MADFDRIYIGIDLATKIENSAVFVVGEASGKLKIIYEPIQHSDAVGPAMPFIFERTKELVTRYPAKEIIAAIDIPFGYPAEFVEWVTGFELTKKTKPDLPMLKYRMTERWLEGFAKDQWQAPGFTGLSVSMDKLGVTFTVGAELIAAMTREMGFTASLGERHPVPRTLIEVYPKASLMSWFKSDKQVVKKYRRSEADRLILIRALMEKFNNAFEPYSITPIQFPTDHAVDSFVAAMTARSYAMGECIAPEVSLPPNEGWIWVPST